MNVVETLSIVDYGDVPVSPGDTERTYAQIEEALAPIVDAGVFAAAMGGDHSITLAELRALAKRHGPLALVQLDSHGDTWEQYFGQQYFHGTTFKRAVEEGLLDAHASVQAGMRGSLYGAEDIEVARELGFTVLSTDELRALGPQGYGELVLGKVGARPVFVSFDIDFLDPAFAPGTGTPEVGGFSTAEALAFLRALRGIKLAGCDVVEVSPPYDGPGMVTALAGGERPLRAALAARHRRRAVSINACLTFDLDAEAPILAESGRHARNAGVMSHQAYGPLVGMPRILDLLREYSLPATFFVPGLTADRYPQAVEAILAAGHEVGHHSYAHFSPVAQTEDEERADFERALATLQKAGAERAGLPLPELGAELAHRRRSSPSTGSPTTRR